MTAVFLDRDSLHPDDLDFSALTAVCPDLVCYAQTAPADTAARLRTATIAISNKVDLTADVIAAAPQLRLIAITATGVNNVDLAAARARDIAVCNVTGYGTASVAQHTFALLLMLSNRLRDYSRDAVNGRWSASPAFCLLDYPVLELAGKTLGIVGYGGLGRAVAKLAEAFGMTVQIAARPGEPVTDGRTPLNELLPQVDVLSLHCLLTPTTAQLLNAERLARLKPGALLVNTARGGLIDEKALAAALRSGQLGGAALDVLTVEPPPADHPLLAPDLPNLVLTPHCAWASREARQRLLDGTAANIRAFLAGQSGSRV